METKNDNQLTPIEPPAGWPQSGTWQVYTLNDRRGCVHAHAVTKLTPTRLHIDMWGWSRSFRYPYGEHYSTVKLFAKPHEAAQYLIHVFNCRIENAQKDIARWGQFIENLNRQIAVGDFTSDFNQ